MAEAKLTGTCDLVLRSLADGVSKGTYKITGVVVDTPPAGGPGPKVPGQVTTFTFTVLRQSEGITATLAEGRS